MPNIIEVNNLRVKYGNLVAVKDISFNVNEGELFALLGKNGAGKSTTINVLCTLLKKDHGKVIINGNDLDKNYAAIKDDIGIVFQQSVLDKLLTVEENIKTRASLYNMSKEFYNSRLTYLIEKLDLQDILKRKYKNLSGGQKRKVDIARALINSPKILFLDEPTTGLDPQTRIKVWKTLNDIRKNEKTTIILTTHYMEETKDADTVVIVDNGEIIASGTPANLKDKFAYDTLKLYYKKNDFKYLKEKLVRYKTEDEVDCIKIMLDKNNNPLALLNNVNEHLNSFELIKGDMDTVFLNVTKGKQLIGGDNNE